VRNEYCVGANERLAVPEVKGLGAGNGTGEGTGQYPPFGDTEPHILTESHAYLLPSPGQ